MTSRLLPLLLCAALFAACHDSPLPPPPPSLRFHVTTSGILSKISNQPLPPSTLTDWLSNEIQHRRINPDVRLDYDANVSVWRMVETISLVVVAGAQATSDSIAFSISGSSGEDFLLSLNPPSCQWPGDTRQIVESDVWGEYIITALPGERHVECEVSLINGTFSASDIGLTPQDLKEMLLARRQTGSVYFVIHSDQSSTAADLLPALQAARGCDILFTQAGESPPAIEIPRHRQKPHPSASPRSLRIPKPPLDAFLHTITILPHHESLFRLWRPAQFQMFATSGSEGMGHSGGTRGPSPDSAPAKNR